MFSYDKFLQFPINIKKPNPRLANIIITQYGGAYCKCLSNLSNASKIRILGTFRLFLLL